ncbi:MAG: AraC family transcriptional regulator [Pseudomonadaceae bacterium]
MLFRATKLLNYLRFADERGIDPSRLLEGSGIDDARIHSPDCLVSLDQYHQVVARLIELSGSPGIAFEVGRRLRLSDLGIVGYALMSANSLRQALEIWFTYSVSLVGMPVRVDAYRDTSPGYEAFFHSHSPAGDIHRFEIEELLVQGATILAHLTETEPLLGRVSLAYPEPAHSALYGEFFRCPIEFNAPVSSIWILAPDLDTPVRTMNEEKFRLCREQCRHVMSLLPESGLVRSQLRNLFIASPADLPDLEQAAAALLTSSSTLRRRLADCGQSYQAIKDEFRFDLARDYLVTRHLPQKQVAYLLGFKSPSAFSRAFKGWSGQTVGEYLGGSKDGAQAPP